MLQLEKQNDASMAIFFLLRGRLIVFRFTIIWEKIIVIIGGNWTAVFVIIQEGVESRVA
jgi:hypothetical protein